MFTFVKWACFNEEFKIVSCRVCDTNCTCWIKVNKQTKRDVIALINIGTGRFVFIFVCFVFDWRVEEVFPLLVRNRRKYIGLKNLISVKFIVSLILRFDLEIKRQHFERKKNFAFFYENFVKCVFLNFSKSSKNSLHIITWVVWTWHIKMSYTSHTVHTAKYKQHPIFFKLNTIFNRITTYF